MLRNDGATEEEIISAMIDFDDNLGMEETISPLKDTPLKNPSKRTVGNTSLEKNMNKQVSFVYTKTQIIKNNLTSKKPTKQVPNITPNHL